MSDTGSTQTQTEGFVPLNETASSETVYILKTYANRFSKLSLNQRQNFAKTLKKHANPKRLYPEVMLAHVAALSTNIISSIIYFRLQTSRIFMKAFLLQT